MAWVTTVAVAPLRITPVGVGETVTASRRGEFMTAWIQILVLLAPFALLGALVAWAIVTIGNGTRPQGTFGHQAATPRPTAAAGPATQRVPPVTFGQHAFGTK
jgi:hypothetical protein